jgi:hypothetical protein
LFFEVLSPELSMEGIIYFFRSVFHKIDDIIKGYFSPSEKMLMQTSCVSSLDGPIMNVLRKSY